MTQTIIKHKLAQFLKLLYPNNNELINHLETTGYCHGFTISYAVMHLIKQLDWWQAVLRTIANWDGSIEALEKTIQFTETSEPIQLKLMFERVLNYVAINQSAHDVPCYSKFMSSEFNQRELFVSDEGLDFVDANGKVQKFHRYNAIAGVFTEEDLNHLIQENNLQNTISMFYSLDHVICIIHNTEWHLYDSNDDHAVDTNIHQTFKTKQALIEAIIKILGHNLAMSLASTDKTKKWDLSYYQSLMKEKPLQLLSEKGLHQLCYFGTFYLSKLMMYAEKQPGFLATLEQALIQKDNAGWSGLQKVIRYLPTLLPRLYKHLDNLPDREVFLNLLQECNTEGETILHRIAYKAGPQIMRFIDWMISYTKAYDLLAKLALLQDKEGQTYLHLIARNAPHLVTSIFEKIMKAKNGQVMLAKALTLREARTGLTLMQLIERQELEMLPKRRQAPQLGWFFAQHESEVDESKAPVNQMSKLC